MNSSQLYIPKRIKVGYQKREDTYTGQLSYIIYFDDKGKLRKETSWEGWRDKKIEPQEFDNEPTTGFVLHKDIKRYNWSHFSSKRTLIRVYDPRGMEFEITTENLIGILMNDDCCKRGLVGSYVYAWSGPELVLLPTCAEEYQKAADYTKLQSGKIGAKQLVPGCGYKTKKEVDLIYVGRYDWHAMQYRDARKTKKHYIFVREPNSDWEKSYAHEGWIWELKSSLDFLATKTTEEPVAEFADIIEAFQKNIHSAKVVKWEVEPVEVSTKTKKSEYSAYYADSLRRSIYHKLDGDILEEWQVSLAVKSEYKGDKYEHNYLGYNVSRLHRFNIKTETIIEEPKEDYHRSYWGARAPEPPPLTEKQLQEQGFCNLYVTLENGRRVRLDNINQL